jgi:TolB-like protein/Flp pilus assembly protein TadD
MSSLKVFISSPGDVAEERRITQEVMARIEADLGGRMRLEPILWEHEPLLASSSFQEQISKPSDTDIAVFILWARLGTQLPKNITRADGSRYASGTEFEFEDAQNAFAEQRKPLILTYRKVTEVGVSLSDADAVLEKLAQKKALDEFERKWFHSTEETSLIGAFHPFSSPAEFESLIEVHLRKLAGRLAQEAETPAGAPAAAVPAEELERDLGGSSAEGRDRIRSLAVLPFTDLSSEGGLEYFCDGIVEELRGVLAGIRGLRVGTRVPAARFEELDRDPRATGVELGVDAAIEGGVRKLGDRLRVRVTLVDVRRGGQIWSERFDREDGDLLLLQDEIARRVAETFEGDAPQAATDSAAPRARDATAYELYLKGLHSARSRTERGLAESIRLYRQAIDHDPGYARAFARIADSYALLGMYGLRLPGEVLARAGKMAAKAISLDPELSQAHASLGCIKSLFHWAWDDAEADFRRALELDPDNGKAHRWYALNNLAPRRRFDQALEHLSRAFSLGSELPVVATSIGVLRLLNDDFDGAEKEFGQALELFPDFALIHYFLGRNQSYQSRHEEAGVTLRRATELDPESREFKSALCYALGAGGQTEAAEKILQELERQARRAYLSPTLLAQAHLGLGRRDEALAQLEQALALHAADLVWLGVNPAFSSLRSEPRFTAILSRLGLDD